MKLHTKLPLLSGIIIFAIILLLEFITLYFYWQIEVKEIEEHLDESFNEIKEKLEENVTNAHELLNSSYKLSLNLPVEAENVMKKHPRLSPVEIAVENLRTVRFNNGAYIWIHELQEPYTIILEPLEPENEGEGRDIITSKYNLADDGKQNLFDAYADICELKEEGFLIHKNYKQGEEGVFEQISYVKLFEPKQWIIGSGIFTGFLNGQVKKQFADLKDKMFSLFGYALLVALGLTLLAALLYYFVGNSISQKLLTIRDYLFRMSRGVPSGRMPMNGTNEIAQISEGVNELMDSMCAYINFATEIEKGNLDAGFIELSEEDTMGIALVEMRNSLKKAKIEEEKRKQENQKRYWFNEGISKFNDILRKRRDSISEIADSVISNLVKYLNANQGGFFVMEEKDDKKYLELVSAFAYNRRKHLKKQVKPGEGLVGACALEKQTIYLTDIPEDYMFITSGIGEASPETLLIFPLKTDQKVLGVIEIASFKRFEKNEIEFVERLAENIASTISTAKIDEQTAKLLRESKKRATEVQKIEAEMQSKEQMIEEWKDKYDAEKREKAALNKVIDLNYMMFIFDVEGRVLEVNDIALETLGMNKHEVMKKNHRDLLMEATETREEYDDFWNQLKAGNSGRKIKFLEIEDKKFWIEETYMPLFDAKGEVHKIIDIANNITEKEDFELRLKQKEAQINQKDKEVSRLKTREEALKKKIQKLNKELKSKKSNQ